MLTAEKIFDMSAKSYDKTEEVQFKTYTDITIENTKRYLRQNDIVLDYGCATGTKTLALAPSVKKIVAVDISSNMIELAESKASEQKAENVKFIRTTIFDELLTQNSFDTVLAFNVLHLLDNGQQVIDRITEILKPGGLLITTTPCLAEKMTLEHTLKYFPVRILMKLGLFMPVIRYKFDEIEKLISRQNLEIIETKEYFYGLSSYFIVARKN